MVNELFELLHELTHDYPFFGGALAAYIIAFMYFVVPADGAFTAGPRLMPRACELVGVEPNGEGSVVSERHFHVCAEDASSNMGMSKVGFC
jgi:hypothetical protein